MITPTYEVINYHFMGGHYFTYFQRLATQQVLGQCWRKCLLVTTALLWQKIFVDSKNIKKIVYFAEASILIKEKMRFVILLVVIVSVGSADRPGRNSNAYGIAKPRVRRDHAAGSGGHGHHGHHQRGGSSGNSYSVPAPRPTSGYGGGYGSRPQAPRPTPTIELRTQAAPQRNTEIIPQAYQGMMKFFELNNMIPSRSYPPSDPVSNYRAPQVQTPSYAAPAPAPAPAPQRVQAQAPSYSAPAPAPQRVQAPAPAPSVYYTPRPAVQPVVQQYQAPAPQPQVQQGYSAPAPRPQPQQPTYQAPAPRPQPQQPTYAAPAPRPQVIQAQQPQYQLPVQPPQQGYPAPQPQPGYQQAQIPAQQPAIITQPQPQPQPGYAAPGNGGGEILNILPDEDNEVQDDDETELPLAILPDSEQSKGDVQDTSYPNYPPIDLRGSEEKDEGQRNVEEDLEDKAGTVPDDASVMEVLEHMGMDTMKAMLEESGMDETLESDGKCKQGSRAPTRTLGCLSSGLW